MVDDLLDGWVYVHFEISVSWMDDNVIMLHDS